MILFIEPRTRKIQEIQTNVQSSITRREKIVQPALTDRCKEETLIFKTAVNLIIERISPRFYKHLNLNRREKLTRVEKLTDCQSGDSVLKRTRDN